MKILVRLPNWLGDVFMSFPFLAALHETYPEAEVSLIVKKGLESTIHLLKRDYIIIPFSKEEHKGLFGGRTFAKGLADEKEYDFFFSLPDSFSSAWIGYFSGAKKRIGYKAEARSILLTNSLVKNQELHRSEQYLALITDAETNKPKATPDIRKVAEEKRLISEPFILFNMNSEAESRTLPSELTVHIIEYMIEEFDYKIILSGVQTDRERVADIKIMFNDEARVEDWSGRTSLQQLFQLAAQAEMTFTTDSGIAHISNSLGTKTMVLFGAGNDAITRPYNNKGLVVIRKPELDCAPCVSNTCKQDDLLCLTQLDLTTLKMEIKALLKD